jgi:hypothetical protein
MKTLLVITSALLLQGCSMIESMGSSARAIDAKAQHDQRFDGYYYGLETGYELCREGIVMMDGKEWTDAYYDGFQQGEKEGIARCNKR